jgi:hypothetical protein
MPDGSNSPWIRDGIWHPKRKNYWFMNLVVNREVIDKELSRHDSMRFTGLNKLLVKKKKI